MKNQTSKGGDNKGKIDGLKSLAMKKNNMKKNLQRLGGGGLSLDAFANAKSGSSGYNPALIKKQREFYKNAKHVSKYRKSKNQQSQHDDSPSIMVPNKDDNEMKDDSEVRERRNKKQTKKGLASLNRVYEKKHQEEEKMRIEREAINRAKNEEIEKAKARRKSQREKMLKKTKKGQPVMKYRIEHLLETIQGSVKN